MVFSVAIDDPTNIDENEFEGFIKTITNSLKSEVFYARKDIDNSKNTIKQDMEIMRTSQLAMMNKFNDMKQSNKEERENFEEKLDLIH